METFLVEAEIRHTISFLPPRKVNPRRRHAVERVPTSVARVAAGQAPVVARLAPWIGAAFGPEPDEWDALKSIPVRAWGGRFYAPLGVDDHSLERHSRAVRNASTSLPWLRPPPGTDADLAAALAKGPLAPDRRWDGSLTENHHPPVGAEELRAARRVEHIDRETKISDLHRASESLLIVDDAPFQAIPEPCWLARNSRSHPTIELRFADDHDVARNPALAWPLHRAADALAAMRWLREEAGTPPAGGVTRGGDRAGRPSVSGAAEVVDPGAFGLRPAPLAAALAAMEMVFSAVGSRHTLLALDARGLAAWARLRDAAAAALDLTPAWLTESWRERACRSTPHRRPDLAAAAGAALAAYLPFHRRADDDHKDRLRPNGRGWEAHEQESYLLPVLRLRDEEPEAWCAAAAAEPGLGLDMVDLRWIGGCAGAADALEIPSVPRVPDTPTSRARPGADPDRVARGAQGPSLPDSAP